MICFGKMLEKHLRKIEIFSKVAGQGPATLLNISLSCKCFSSNLAKHIIYLVFLDGMLGMKRLSYTKMCIFLVKCEISGQGI